jgi:proteasome lid subunit RPN8/RPN11
MGEPRPKRLAAVCELTMAECREGAGLHEYDGVVQDLSPAGVVAGLGRLGGPPLDDPHDEAHLAAFEAGLRVAFGDLGLHRRNPLVHLSALDLSCYARTYAPEGERAEARLRHLAAWPDAVDAAIESLDEVPAPVAEALLPAAQGLVSEVDGAAGAVEARALAAHARLVDHLRLQARAGNPDTALGGSALAALMGSAEGVEVDLDRLAARADAERERLHALLADGCARVARDAPPDVVVGRLLTDHPDASGVVAEAATQCAEVLAFTREHDLVPWVDGDCLVGPAPPARRWAMAMMTWAAPEEADAPSWYHITPPEPSWADSEQEEWLQAFSRTTLPVITVHEVAPGHFAHGRCLRRVTSTVRRVLHSPGFSEGWAHYTEEMVLEEGFRADDPRFAVGVAFEGLVRVTRLTCAIGLHTGAMTVPDAARRFEQDAFLPPPAARAEARRGTFDPAYGQYTWGKLVLADLREEARRAWGSSFTLPRYHAALMDLGAPPLGLVRRILDGPALDAPTGAPA